MERFRKDGENLLRLLRRKEKLFEKFLIHTLELAKKTEDLDIVKITGLIAKRQALIFSIDRIDNRINALKNVVAVSTLSDSQKFEITRLFQSLKKSAREAAQLTEEFEASLNCSCRHFRNEISGLGSGRPNVSPYAAAADRLTIPRFLDTRL